MNPEINWVLKPFHELTGSELYAILQLRNEVFVVEQDCVYQDADGKDPESLHFCGWDADKLAAYTRILPPETSYPEASIGRVVTSPAYRGTGLGKIIMQKSIENCIRLFGPGPIRIGAQLYLRIFYQSLGFRQSSEEYLEDGIPHIEMILDK